MIGKPQSGLRGSVCKSAVAVVASRVEAPRLEDPKDCRTFWFTDTDPQSGSLTFGNPCLGPEYLLYSHLDLRESLQPRISAPSLHSRVPLFG